MEEELYDDLEDQTENTTIEDETKCKELFDDFADEDAKLPKDKVGEAIRCLGHNPLESEVSGWLTGFSGSHITFQQFIQVVASAEASLESTIEEVTESLGAFDLDGEGWIPIGQLKHLMCTDAGDPQERLSPEEFDFLISDLSERDGFIRYAEIAHLLTES
eukprot:TRINITY_DN50441_c0_g1_i1.p1 TRINITY_DN50441_c0_g1~~TRINITY_DN50441_c0_g1_i1.p1  ORF type:complete len:161 (-),score=37.25 TRINITY_DN50441_c0_g1_i1:41-523(-)